MNVVDFIYVVCWIFIALLLIVQPWLTRKNVLFGIVFGSEDIWMDPIARKIRRRYLLVMIFGTVILGAITELCFLFVKPFQGDGILTFFGGLFLLFLLGTGAIIYFHARARAFKIARGQDDNLMQGRIFVETSSSDRKTIISAAWLLLLLPVLVAAIAVALYGCFTMPSERLTFLFPVLVDVVVVAILLISCLFTRRAPASVRGNPDAAPENYRFRKYMVLMLIVIGIFLELSMLFAEIGFLTPISPLLCSIPAILSMLVTFIIFVLYFRLVRAKKSKGPILDDDAKWVLGMFYFNPADPSCFVEKRFGIGYTLNFARPASWAFLIGIIGFAVFVTIISLQIK